MKILILAFAAVGVGVGVYLLRPVETPTVEPTAENAWFADVTDASGVRFVHDAGPTDGSHFLPQIMGSGAALFDANGDGRLDLYLIQNGGPTGARNALFLQRDDRTFIDASAGSGLDVAGNGMGVAAADADNDGRPDVYLTGYAGDRFFRNLGDGKFREVTREVGVDNPVWGTSASFLDYDRDGWLDVVVANYLVIDPKQACTDAAGRRSYCHPNTFPGAASRLYRNRGQDAGGAWLGFEDRTAPSGFATAPGPGLGVVCADFDGDGWVDVFLANDAKANHLWINRHDGTFREEALARGVAFNAAGQAQGNMGVALGDADSDGLDDLFVTHLTSEYHALWKQGPRGQFREKTAAAGLTRARWRGTGFGTVMADFDHDGDLDVAIVNGLVARSPEAGGSYWSAYAERNQVFANDGAGVFRDASGDHPDFCGKAGVSRGLAVVDIDGDGAPDLVVTQIAGPARMFRNVARNRGHWLVVRAVEGGRDAIGAEVAVRAGGRRWSRLVQPGQSYLCSNDPVAHFGLGAATTVDDITVTWADGKTEVFPGGPADRVVVLRKGASK